MSEDLFHPLDVWGSVLLGHCGGVEHLCAHRGQRIGRVLIPLDIVVLPLKDLLGPRCLQLTNVVEEGNLTDAVEGAKLISLILDLKIFLI
jgi:hypothetical protein